MELMSLPEYGIHDTRFDRAWVSCLELGKDLKDGKRDRSEKLVEEIKSYLHPESVHDGSEKHLVYNPARKLTLPDYLVELGQGLDLVGTDDAAAFKALGKACWDVFSSHPGQFALASLKKVWPKRPE